MRTANSGQTSRWETTGLCALHRNIGSSQSGRQKNDRQGCSKIGQSFLARSNRPKHRNCCEQWLKNTLNPKSLNINPTKFCQTPEPKLTKLTRATAFICCSVTILGRRQNGEETLPLLNSGIYCHQTKRRYLMVTKCMTKWQTIGNKIKTCFLQYPPN